MSSEHHHSLSLLTHQINHLDHVYNYVRWETSDHSFAKSRVSPLKPLTIPHMELQAAVLAVRLAQSILNETRVKCEKIIFSHSQARDFKSFISARIAEIQSKSEPC